MAVPETPTGKGLDAARWLFVAVGVLVASIALVSVGLWAHCWFT